MTLKQFKTFYTDQFAKNLKFDKLHVIEDIKKTTLKSNLAKSSEVKGHAYLSTQ